MLLNLDSCLKFAKAGIKIDKLSDLFPRNDKKKNTNKRWWNIQSKVPKHKQTKAFPHHNNDSIRNIVSKIQVLDKALEARTEDLKKQNNVINQKRNQANQIVCKHYNRGFCKLKSLCWYFHPTDICKIFLKDGKCWQGLLFKTPKLL